MVNVLEQIKHIAQASKQESQQVESLFVLMREFHWTIWEVDRLPLPTMQIMLELLKKEQRMNKQGMNKK